MNERRFQQLENLLRRDGELTAHAIAKHLGISQPTVSRLLAAGGSQVVRIGRARASRYALARQIGRDGGRWPLYRIDPAGRAHRVGALSALHGERFLLEPPAFDPSPSRGIFADGLYPGLPWFLDDQRPQGFLGRAFARRIAAGIGAPADLLRWRVDDVLLALLRHSENRPGDFVLGEAALQRAQQAIAAPTDCIAAKRRKTHYPALAEAALRGEAVGSSAGGEQPKFAITLRDGDGLRPVIVKFSPRDDSAAGRRWADLLRAEHIAAVILRAHDVHAAHTNLVIADDRVFLEATRFDRTPVLGRRGFVSLAAVDTAFHGNGRLEWWRYAATLQRDGWLDADNARHLRLLSWFGTLIGNTDMHLGNAGLLLDAADIRVPTLAPAYDMLPMAFRPTAGGEVLAHDLTVVPPPPECRDDWLQAATIALVFWREVARTRSINADFATIAQRALVAVEEAVERA
ncbi:MAG: type II toxin-antitoxin system HipA family toxin YjjJ [Proteobacteria bacterium]|nr:type II toxin-antitoxin system HipA family toxin YjjJ [Pseudomonadota bacterium]